MIELPTPETDAFAIKFKTPCGEKHWVPVDIARKLERERDEAIEKHRFAVIHWQRDVFKMQRERDEAREHLRAANKGAETNAKINQSLANQIINANAMADKAKELIARWDQPSWKDTAPTAGFIYALRNAVEAYEKQKP